MYEILFSPSAKRDYKKIPQNELERINQVINNLSETLRPVGYKKLSGRDAYRVRVGNFRIIYEIHNKELIIMVIRIRDRKEVYKK